MLTHLDLFSGIGGFALACQWAGIETICFVEKDAYCQKVLRKHYPAVPIVEDIRDVEKIKEIATNTTGEGLPDRRRASLANTGGEKPESQRCDNSRSRIQSNAGSGLANRGKPTILITAGFPCQPFSVAGKREGEADDRYLWPETLAVIEAVKPTWVLLENVAGIINLALDTVLSDLEGAGYSWETLVIPACAVNAPHRRDRIWIVAHATNNGQYRNDPSSDYEGQISKNSEQSGSRWTSRIERCGSDVANTRSPESRRLSGKQRQENTEIGHSDWWTVEPAIRRVAHGIPNRVDRLKCLGNAIVPAVAYQIIKVIADYENNSL